MVFKNTYSVHDQRPLPNKWYQSPRLDLWKKEINPMHKFVSVRTRKDLFAKKLVKKALHLNRHSEKTKDWNLIKSMKKLSLEKNEPRSVMKKLKKSRCYVCKVRGHAFWNCPLKKRNDNYEAKGKASEAVDQEKDDETEHITGDYLVLETDGGNWNEIWYVTKHHPRHMTPNCELFVQFKDNSDDTEEHNTKFSFTNGVGEIDLKSNGKTYVIPYVAYVPKIGLNLLSLQQLTSQGFEVNIFGSTCTIRYMFDAKFEDTVEENVLNTQDVSRNKYFADLNKEDVETITKYSDELIGDSMKIEEEDFIDIEGMQVPLTVNSYTRFIEFMKMTNKDKIAMRNRDLFRVHFEKMIDWFYTWNDERTVIGEIPPRLAGIEICLFDVYKLVKCLGGYEKVTIKDNWEDVSMGFGFPACYRKMFKRMYEKYLLLPDAHYEFARGEPARSGYATGDLQDIGAETNECKDQQGDSRSTPTKDDQDASVDNEAKGMCSKTRTSSSEETDPNIVEFYSTSGSIGDAEGSTTKSDNVIIK